MAIVTQQGGFKSREDYLAWLQQMRSQTQQVVPGISDSDLDSLTSDQDAWYYDMIKQYEGTSWYNELLSNPHLVWNNAQFSPNLWQQLGEIFGDYSARANYYEGLRSSANQWLSEKLSQMRQQGYDTAASQVARERAAGINPDISGGQGITPGAAAENDQPFAPHQMDGSSVVQSTAQLGISLVSQVMSMAQGIQSLRAGSSQLIAQEIENHGSAMDLLFNEVASTLPISDFSDASALDSKVILKALEDIRSDSSFSPRTRKILSRYADSIQGDAGTAKLQTIRQELANRYFEAKKKNAGYLGDPLFDEDFTKWVSNVGEYFNNYVFECEKAQYGAKIAQARYNSNYFHSRNAVGSATAANTADSAQNNINTFISETNKLWAEVSSFLSKDSHWYSKLALVFLPYLRSLSLGQFNLPLHFDNSTTFDTTNSVTNKYGPTVINN